MIRVVYDYQTFSMQKYGGISRYFCELAAQIQCAPGFEARVVAPLHFNSYLAEHSIPKSALYVPMRVPRTGRLYLLVNRLLAPPLTRLKSPSLIHRTYYAPFTGAGNVPVVVTVFDMIHELFPASFLSNDVTSRNKRQCVESADHILCISDCTANDLVRLLGVSRSKITVTHLGFSDVFEQPAPNDEVAPHGRPYILYVGDRGGYKNFDTALLSYAASKNLTSEFDLVAFGGHAFSANEHALIAKLPVRTGSVVQLGGSDVELARAYRHARAFVYPSRYEGFGIPPLEAMSSGCVVACSNSSSIPDVVGDAALLFDPDDIEAARRALEEACFSEDTRIRLVTRGKLRVREFTWDRCARETVDVYRRVLNLNSRFDD